MEWMILPLKRYADFQGRSRRREFWMWVLFVLIALVVLSVIDEALGFGGSTQLGRVQTPPGPGIFAYAAGVHGGMLTKIFGLAILIPNLALQVRRLHDTNRTGWWLLAWVIPYVIALALLVASIAGGDLASAATGGGLMLLALIGAIAVLVFLCLEGTKGPNRFGPDPKNPAGDLTSVFR